MQARGSQEWTSGQRPIRARSESALVRFAHPDQLLRFNVVLEFSDQPSGVMWGAVAKTRQPLVRYRVVCTQRGSSVHMRTKGWNKWRKGGGDKCG